MGLASTQLLVGCFLLSDFYSRYKKPKYKNIFGKDYINMWNIIEHVMLKWEIERKQ